jgi:hypothetical protein
MTLAEPLDRAMAPAEEVTSAALYARHEVPTAQQTTQKAAALHARQDVQTAQQTTQKAAAVRATLEATMEAAAQPTAVGPESHLQREVRTA